MYTTATLDVHNDMGGYTATSTIPIEVRALRQGGSGGISGAFVYPIDPTAVPISARKGWWVSGDGIEDIYVCATA